MDIFGKPMKCRLGSLGLGIRCVHGNMSFLMKAVGCWKGSESIPIYATVTDKQCSTSISEMSSIH